MDDIKTLKFLQENVCLKDIFSQDFLDKLGENFEDIDIIPIGVAFALKKDDINIDMVNMTYRNDDDIQNDTVLIDVQTNPDNANKFRKTLNGR